MDNKCKDPVSISFTEGHFREEEEERRPVLVIFTPNLLGSHSVMVVSGEEREKTAIELVIIRCSIRRV